MIEQFWLFHCGYFRAFGNILDSGAGFAMRRVPFLAAIAVHPEHGPIVIDAPFGHEGPNNAGSVLGVTFRLLGQQFRRDWSIVPRVRECGFRAAEVNHVLMTHLHYDHTGGMKELAHATFYVNRDEWDFANGEGGLFQGYIKNDYRAVARTSFLDEDDHDVFGDGSIVARKLPGHSIGMTGYRITLTTGKQIEFLGDAAFSVAQIEDSVEFGTFPKQVAWDLAKAEETLALLREEAQEDEETVRIVSHDPEFGKRCRRAPLPLHTD